MDCEGIEFGGNPNTTSVSFRNAMVQQLNKKPSLDIIQLDEKTFRADAEAYTNRIWSDSIMHGADVMEVIGNFLEKIDSGIKIKEIKSCKFIKPIKRGITFYISSEKNNTNKVDEVRNLSMSAHLIDSNGNDLHIKGYSNNIPIKGMCSGNEFSQDTIKYDSSNEGVHIFDIENSHYRNRDKKGSFQSSVSTTMDLITRAMSYIKKADLIEHMDSALGGIVCNVQMDKIPSFPMMNEKGAKFEVIVQKKNTVNKTSKGLSIIKCHFNFLLNNESFGSGSMTFAG